MITITGRTMQIPDTERNIGVERDNNVEIRRFEITEQWLFGFNFKLDMRNSSGRIEIIELIKTVALDRIVLTWEIREEHLQSGTMNVQIRAFDDGGLKWHSNIDHFKVSSAIKATSAFPSTLPSEFEQMEQRVTAMKNEVESDRKEVADNTQTVADNLETVLTKAAKAVQSAADALASEENAHTSAEDAEESNQSALTAMQTAVQAMTDLLNLMGEDIATLTNGKLTPSQIPAVAITDTFVVGSEGEMLALICETGDIAIRTDQNKTYILQGTDPTILTDWQQLQVPTNYADMAGHAITADEAENANKINNKRLVAMTLEQYEVAVKDPDTIYLVG